MREIAIIDFETTGLCAGRDRVIEVAAVIVRDGIVVATFSQLMDPGFGIPSFISGLTGISNAMVRGKPSPEAVMPRLRAFLGAHVCVAHNASFDQRFFNAEMALAGEAHERSFLCSMLLARRLVAQAPNHRLGTLVQHLRLPAPAGMQAHRALADVLMTHELWRHLQGLLSARLAGRALDVALVSAIMKKPKAALAEFLAALAKGHRLATSA